MALRAREAFVAATPEGKLWIRKDAVVSAAIAKGRDALVYDDGADPAPKRGRKADAEVTEA